EVAQRYLHTKAGAAAVLKLVTWHLDRGRYVQAGLALKTFMLRNPKDELPADLLFKAAIAFKRHGDAEKVKEGKRYWDRFEKASNKGQVVIGTKTLSYEQAKAEYDKAVPIKQDFTPEWSVARGNPRNAGVGSGSTPFLEPRFLYPYMMPADDINFDNKKSGFEVIKDRVEKALKQMDSKAIAPISGVFPLASSGKVIFRGYDGAYC